MVSFLATHPKRGNVKVVGPVTGLEYEITPFGTPVSDYDLPDLLKMTGPPCCGQSLPFGGEVKLFGKTSATHNQMESVPLKVMAAMPNNPKPSAGGGAPSGKVEDKADSKKAAEKEKPKAKVKQED